MCWLALMFDGEGAGPILESRLLSAYRRSPAPMGRYVNRTSDTPPTYGPVLLGPESLVSASVGTHKEH
jgi:hypothetical protein